MASCKCGQDASSASCSCRHDTAKPARHGGKHALWVGNIAPNTTVMDLRDFFWRVGGLVSISYNPDARYAFVNYSSEAARVAALEQAAARLFNGKRLDCRIRQDAASRSTKVSYGLRRPGSAAAISIATDPNPSKDLWHKVEELSHFPESDRSQWGRDKYFIIKSFSLQALDQSLGRGKWYIPKRHAERLNHAFQSASNVYFIFSVNGSGEFFGYARMTSEIDTTEEVCDGPTEDVDTGSVVPQDKSHLSRTLSQTSTDSSSTSNPGSIQYEPERRRIIWKAAPAPAGSDSSSLSTTPTRTTTPPLSTTPLASLPPPSSISTASTSSFTSMSMSHSTSTSTSSSASASTFSGPDPLLSKLSDFSNPCSITWLAAQAVSFGATRGVLNAWNDHKPIHVARNVTAIEPGAGAALLHHWRGKEGEPRELSGPRRREQGLWEATGLRWREQRLAEEVGLQMRTRPGPGYMDPAIWRVDAKSPRS